MHNARLMDNMKCLGHLRGPAYCVVNCGNASRDPIGKVLAFDQVHHDKPDSGLGLSNPVDAHNAGMLQPLYDGRFGQKSFDDWW